MRTYQLERLAILLIVATGVLAALAVVYLTVPAHSLPAFLGGVKHTHYKRAKRGDAAAVLAIITLVGALLTLRTRRNRVRQER